MSAIAASFLKDSAAFLRETYLPRLQRATLILPPEDTWWRAHADALSAGTILSHLNGNVRQWIVCGLGGEVDARDRAAEFDAQTGPPATELLDTLQDTVIRAAEVLEQLDPQRLEDDIALQGFETNVFWAIYHVVEHFSWHTGQYVMLAKQRAGADHGLAYYDDAALAKARNAER